MHLKSILQLSRTFLTYNIFQEYLIIDCSLSPLFICNIPNIDTLEVINEKNIENEYKKCLDEFSHKNLIKIIKTTYLRNKSRIDSKKKISDKDDMYFKMAEKLLYTEFSLALNMSYDDTKYYVVSKVKESSDNNESN